MTDTRPPRAARRPDATSPRRRLGASRPQAGERKHLVRNILTWILRIVLVLFFALPLVFMFVSSFKPDQQIFADLGSLRAFLPVGRPVPGQLPGDLRTGAVRAGSCSTRS